jgi:hypothetical protein
MANNNPEDILIFGNAYYYEFILKPSENSAMFKLKISYRNNESSIVCKCGLADGQVRVAEQAPHELCLAPA